MDQMQAIRERHISLMQQTCQTLGHILSDVDQETATTLRDGPDGWTVLEVVCHLRDFDEFFYGRAVMMLDQDQPVLPAYDHEALAIERNYNSQDLRQTYTDLTKSRQRFVEFFEALTEVQWSRDGHHPERDHFSMLDSLMQVGLHDVVHLEQITRILTQRH